MLVHLLSVCPPPLHSGGIRLLPARPRYSLSDGTASSSIRPYTHPREMSAIFGCFRKHKADLGLVGNRLRLDGLLKARVASEGILII